MKTKLFLIFIAVSVVVGLLFYWSVKDDFVTLQEKIERPDYQAYTK